MIKTWWTEREPRERHLILTAIVISAAIVLYQFIFVPSQNFMAAQSQRYRTTLAEYSDVRSAAATAQSRAEPASSRQPLQSLLTNTAGLYGLTITRLSPAEDDGLNLWLDGVSPQLLYAWVGDLETSHGVRVGKASVRLDQDSNSVSANFYMSRAL